MDAVSPAASVIAVASITIQIADSIQKLAAFWSNVKDAPADIHSIAGDLRLLIGILTDIAAEAQHTEPDASLVATLQICQSRVRELISILDRFERSFASGNLTTKTWASVKAVLKSEKLEKFQRVIESLKSSLILIQQKQQSSSRSIRHGFQAQRQDLMLITQKLPALASNHTLGWCADDTATPVHFRASTDGEMPIMIKESPNVSRRSLWYKRKVAFDDILIQCGIGTITGDWKQLELKHADGDNQIPDQQETRYSYSFVPAEWFKSLGFNRKFQVNFLSSSITGWQHTLQTACIVPDESLIFTFCEQGNLDGVRRLFIEGDASARDTNSLGCTPLHYAAQYHKAELCSYLILCGADRSAKGSWLVCYSPLAIALSSSLSSGRNSEVIDTLRHFVDLVDFDEEWASFFGVYVQLIGPPRDYPYHNGDEHQKVVLWLLDILASQIRREQFWESEARIVCEYLNKAGYGNVLYFVLRVGPTNAINTVRDTRRYTAVHVAVLHSKCSIVPLLTKDVDFHAPALDPHYSSKPESPTSLAMYHYWNFRRWVQALLETGKDIDALIHQETRDGPLFDAGWKSSTLRFLFDVDLLKRFSDLGSPKSPRVQDKCDDCHDELCGLKTQPYWLIMLEEIKTGASPEEWLEKERRAGTPPRQWLRKESSNNGPAAEPRLESVRSEWEEEVEVMTGFDEDQHSFEFNDVLCLECWEHFKETGKMYSTEDEDESSSEEEEEEEYSPFYVHN